MGTPYTVYLGRNLYNTFMQAYTLVDSNVRKSMEGMLKTWKEPVPGSMDPRPVFHPETVRPIENALIKAKTVAMQSHRPMAPDYRNTPTPPNYANRFAPPPTHTPPQPYQNLQPGFQSLPNAPTPQSTYYQHAPQQPPPNNELDAVKREVSGLIAQRQAQYDANRHDQRSGGELKALMDLQQLLNAGQYIDPASLQQIRDRVSGLANGPSAHLRPTPQPGTPQWQPSPSFPQEASQFARPAAPYSQPPPGQQPPAALLAPGALDGLQALLANGQKPGTPQIRATAPALQSASHAQLSNVQNQAAAAPQFNGADLIASLTRNGLLPKSQQQPPPHPQPTPVPNSSTLPFQPSADLLRSLSSILPPTPQTGTPTFPAINLPPTTSKPRIPMTAAALKQFRPELVTTLYEAQPNQCSTCGRRFLSTDEGRTKKARHLDWHFRTNQRIADPAISRGAHRDWYPTEIDWVRLKDYDPSTTTAEEASALAAASNSQFSSPTKGKAHKRPEEMYVRAPPGVTRNTCSICFEEMKSAYAEELQEWVFWNARLAQGKIVHATCLAEMAKSGGAAGLGAGQRQRSATPESSLGKRKADGVGLGGGGGSKLRME